jgi:ERCC4-type nuclease
MYIENNVLSVLANKLTIIVDTREKKNSHITDFFKKNNISYVCKKIDAGDYSFTLNGESYDHKISIERKSSLDELAGNLTKGRDRFAREFERAHKEKCKVFLMIENGSWEDIAAHKYRSLFTPKAFKASLETWSNKFMFDIQFVKKVKAGEFIVSKFLEYSNNLF